MTHEHLNWPGDDVDAQAAYWWTVLNRTQICPTHQKSHEMWLEEKRQHRECFERLTMIYRAAGTLNTEPTFLAERREALRPRQSILGIVQTWLDMLPFSQFRPAIWTLVTVAAVGSLVAFGVILSLQSTSLPSGNVIGTNVAATSDHRYRTNIGERSTIELDDNSRLELSTETQVQVEMTPKVRSLVLHKGQALFEVAKDAKRPFIVHAAGHQIVAIGTKFEVRVDGTEVQVTLLEGRIKVIEPVLADRPTTDQLPRIVSVLPQQRYNSTNSAVETLSSAQADRLLSWRNGRLDFESEPLGKVVYEINRYSVQKIRIANPDLDRLPISGSFKVGSAKRFAEALTIVYPVKATSNQEDNEITLSR
jgi:transmembrane sensor